MPPPLSCPRGHRSALCCRADGNVAVLSHAEYIPALTAAATLTFDLLTLKVVSETRVTLATSVPILVFLGLSVLNLGPMYVTDVRQKHSLMTLPIRGRGITMVV